MASALACCLAAPQRGQRVRAGVRVGVRVMVMVRVRVRVRVRFRGRGMAGRGCWLGVGPPMKQYIHAAVLSGPNSTVPLHTIT